MANSPIKLLGCCTNCDKEVYEIKKRYPSDHPLAREPKQVGKILPIARKKIFILSDGSTMDLTYCDKCKPDLLRDWNKVMRSWQREFDPTHRKILNLDPTDTSWLLKMTKVIPLKCLE